MRKHKDKRKYRVFVYERSIWTPQNYEGDWTRFEITSRSAFATCIEEIQSRWHDFEVYVFEADSEACFKWQGMFVSRYDAYIDYLS